MARDVDSLALCMKALLCQEMFQLDPTVPPIPFNEEVSPASFEGAACSAYEFLRGTMSFTVCNYFLTLFEGLIHHF